jgi:hypothetical protein
MTVIFPNYYSAVQRCRAGSIVLFFKAFSGAQDLE